ncbi:MAG: cupin domain-containing protein [Planctomycetaceae bacterium]|nr:cupin domain-containing protein [Planctomycetaceae bacterium]
MPSAQPSILFPAEGTRFLAGPFTIASRVAGAQTGGAFELYELTLGAATIDYHVHQKMDETLCVIEGEIEFVVAGKKFLRPAGSVAFVPRGIHHGFTNPGPDRARVLVLFNPAGNQHEYFLALEKLFAAPTLDVAALKALQKTYDQELVAPE